MMEHEIRARMLGATIADVIEICGPDGDELILEFPDGDAVTIKADRLRLTHDPTFAADLAKIKIIDGRTGQEIVPHPIH